MTKTGFKTSLPYVVDHINTYGPYDGVIGFSQGGYIARFLAIYQKLHPSNKLPKLLHPIKFSVLVSNPIILKNQIKSFKASGLYEMDMYKWLANPDSIPTMYINGRKDPMYMAIQYGIIKEGDW